MIRGRGTVLPSFVSRVDVGARLFQGHWIRVLWIGTVPEAQGEYIPSFFPVLVEWQ